MIRVEWIGPGLSSVRIFLFFLYNAFVSIESIGEKLDAISTVFPIFIIGDGDKII